MDNISFWNFCALAIVSFSAAILLSAIASIRSSVCASQFGQRERRSASAFDTDTERQETIPRVSTSPIFPPESSYQVFLSFRGEDTRKGFADHLYHALVNAGIFVFMDNNALRVGEEIDPELHRAISESKISIPIISQRYASSKWCLQELTQAIACKKSSGHIVLPILYKVEPSHVRHQTGSFGEAFNSLREHCEPKAMEEWEQALKDVTSLTIWESEKIANGNEGELVKLVVEAVLSELEHDFQLDVPEHLVGINHHVEEIMGVIDTNFSNTLMIGIYGMGGIGKTTLAKHIYNKLSKKFVHRSFIPDIQENGIQRSQNQLISDILRSEHDVSRVDDGINTIRSRFRSKRALIFLDDVNNDDQLDSLTRECTWFGSGSKIFVTTRDECVLDRAKFGVHYKYELEVLDPRQSLLLFCKHAFRSDSPLSEFQLLSHDVVATTGGLPLALEVIGSLLFGIRDYRVWEDTIKKLRNAPEEKVQEKLKISYNALDYKTQQIFLDIACFFNGEDTTKPTYIWDDYNFAPRIQIHLLVRRCLLKIKGNEFKMHDQLRDLGRAIIHQEDYNEPKNRSRLWDYEEAMSVLNRHEGSEKIQAIRMAHRDLLTVPVYKNGQLEKLPNLRILDATSVNFEGDFQGSFSELRWLRWNNMFGLCRELTNVHLQKLVILELLHSSMDSVGWSSMKRLKVLELFACPALRTFPDLSHCTNLEILSLQHCNNLEGLHASIGGMKNLISLNLSCCWGLKELPTEVSKLLKLRKLLVVGCPKLEKLPNLSRLKQLTKLELFGCPKLTEITGLEGLASLTRLDALACPKLSRFDGLQDLEMLKYLDMSLENDDDNDDDEDQVSTKFLGRLKFLEELNVSGRNFIKMLDLTQLHSLRELHARNCKNLVEIRGLDKVELLEVLDISGCKSIERLSDLSYCKTLKVLRIDFCESLHDIESIQKFSSCQSVQD